MRITTSKSKNSESFYITHSYINHKGKSTSKIFKKLGTLDYLSKKLNTDRDGVMAWAKQQAEIETKKYNEEREIIRVPFSPIKQIDKDKDRVFNVGYLFLQSILSSLRVDNIIRNIKGALEILIKDEKLRTKLANNGHIYAQQFNEKKYHDDFIKIIE